MKAHLHPWTLYLVKIRISIRMRGKEKKILVVDVLPWLEQCRNTKQTIK